MDLFRDLLARQRGIILVTGHYGNWEIGSVFMRRVLDMPLTVVAMAEANEQVNRMRREIRDSLGTDTIEVRKSLDTRAADPAAAVGERRRGDADGPPPRSRSRRGHFPRPAGRHFSARRRSWAISARRRCCRASSRRLGPGRFSVQPGEPIFVSRDLPRDEAIRVATQRFAAQLEARVRAQPAPLVSVLSLLEGTGRVLRGLID